MLEKYRNCKYLKNKGRMGTILFLIIINVGLSKNMFYDTLFSLCFALSIVIMAYFQINEYKSGNVSLVYLFAMNLLALIHVLADDGIIFDFLCQCIQVISYLIVLVVGLIFVWIMKYDLKRKFIRSLLITIATIIISYELLKEIKEETILNNVIVEGCKDFLFVNTNRNKPIIPRQLSDSLEATCKKYNKKEIKLVEKENREPQLLPSITSHILRHTACTRMAEAGVDLKVIQGIMGHKHIDTTMDIYNHVNVQRMNQEAKKMNNIVTLDFTTAAVI